MAHVPLQAQPTPTTVAYLQAKKRNGHLLLQEWHLALDRGAPGSSPSPCVLGVVMPLNGYLK